MSNKLGRKMTRDEIVKIVTESGDVSEKSYKKVIIPPPKSADFKKISKSLNLKPDSKQFKIIKVFCDKKKATSADTKNLAQRIKGFNNEQLIILELICKGNDYTSKIILQFVQWMKKFGTNRLLTLHAFVSLKGVLPGHLLQFFMANFPKHTQKEIGKKAYLEERSELTMNLNQIDIFYNICSQISGIAPKIALSILPKIRQLKPQHAQIINTFLNENISFGEKPVKGNNITGLINLWLSLPEMTDKVNFQKLFKNLSKKPAKKKNDFQFLIQSFKKEIENEKGNEKSSGNITSTIRNFFK